MAASLVRTSAQLSGKPCKPRAAGQPRSAIACDIPSASVRALQHQFRSVPATAPARHSVRKSTRAHGVRRFGRVTIAYTTGFVDRSEDPERLLDTITAEMEADMQKVRDAVARVLDVEKQTTVKYEQARATAEEWQRRAELAVAKSQDDLAREALLRRRTYQETAAALKPQLDAQRRAAEQLQGNYRLLEAKLREAQSKRTTLKARAAAARAAKELQEMIGGLGLKNRSALPALEKLEAKVAALEAEANTATSLSAPGTLERQFMLLEDGLVDDELAVLKNQVRGRAGRPADTTSAGLGENRAFQQYTEIRDIPVSDGRPTYSEVIDVVTIDDELEFLRQKARQ